MEKNYAKIGLTLILLFFCSVKLNVWLRKIQGDNIIPTDVLFRYVRSVNTLVVMPMPLHSDIGVVHVCQICQILCYFFSSVF